MAEVCGGLLDGVLFLLPAILLLPLVPVFEALGGMWDALDGE